MKREFGVKGETKRLMSRKEEMQKSLLFRTP